MHQPRILELILEKGANLRKAPGVLELAASINSLEAVTILLKHGVDVDAKKDGIFTVSLRNCRIRQPHVTWPSQC